MSAELNKDYPVLSNGRTELEAADIFRQFFGDYLATHKPSEEEMRAANAIINCRTEVMGGNIYTCDKCGHEVQSYNSCLNRNCPKCQCVKQAKWVNNRMARILPVEYFHVVFTLPSKMRGVTLGNKRPIYEILFKCAAETLNQFALNERWIGGQPAITTVLHTWTRDLLFHPHLHCIVSAGGLSPDKSKWMPSRFEAKYLFPVRALSKVFRAKFVEALEKVHNEGKIVLNQPYDEEAEKEAFAKLKKELFKKPWRIYAKRAFGGPEQVIKYLGQYIHRVAISNHRLISLDENGVRFHTKDGKCETLEPVEFIRRFLLHIVPGNFTKIRHYGLFSSNNVNSKLNIAFELLRGKGRLDQEEEAATECSPAAEPDTVEMIKELTGIDVTKCPKCEEGVMRKRAILPSAFDGRAA